MIGEPGESVSTHGSTREVSVRRLTPVDAALAARAIAGIKRGAALANEAAEADRLCRWLGDPDRVLLVATDTQRPVGFALGYLLDRIDADAQMLCFYEIEVLASHRRRGIGTRLVEAMKAVARSRRVIKMWVQTDPANVAARGLYEHTGAARSDAPDEVYTWDAASLKGSDRA